MNENSNQRVLILDAVGTLIRPAKSVSQSYFEVGKSFGSEKTQSQIKAEFSQLFQSIFRAATPTSEVTEKQNWRELVSNIFDDVEQQESLFQMLWEYFADPQSWQLFEDVEIVWPNIVQSAEQIGIASNFDARLHKILAATPPLNSVNNIFVSSEIGFPKPREEFFDEIESRFNRNTKFVMVGDDPICDIQPAAERGWQTVLIDRLAKSDSNQTVGLIDAVLKPVVIRSLQELPETLRIV